MNCSIDSDCSSDLKNMRSSIYSNDLNQVNSHAKSSVLNLKISEIDGLRKKVVGAKVSSIFDKITIVEISRFPKSNTNSKRQELNGQTISI